MQSDHPLFRRFENEFTVPLRAGQSMKIEWTTEGQDFYLRPYGGEVRMVWAILGRVEMASQLGSAKAYDNAQAKRRLSHGIESLHLRRFWPTSSGSKVFLRGRYGLLNTERGAVLLRFELPRNARISGSGRMVQPWKDVAALISSLEQDAHSDLSKALCLRPLMEDPWSWMQWNKGTRAEMESLIRAYLALTAPNKFSSYLFHGLKVASAFSDLHTFDVRELARRMKLKNLLVPAFDVAPSLHVKRIYSANAYAWKRYHKPLEIEVVEPTAHERLEALLLWRDFLRGKMPDAEIEALLRPVAA